MPYLAFAHVISSHVQERDHSLRHSIYAQLFDFIYYDQTFALRL